MIEILICMGIALLIMTDLFMAVKLFVLIQESEHYDIIKPFIILFFVLTGLVFLLRYSLKTVETQNFERRRI